MKISKKMELEQEKIFHFIDSKNYGNRFYDPKDPTS